MNLIQAYMVNARSFFHMGLCLGVLSFAGLNANEAAIKPQIEMSSSSSSEEAETLTLGLRLTNEFWGAVADARFGFVADVISRIFQGVSELNPGTSVSVDNRSLKIENLSRISNLTYTITDLIPLQADNKKLITISYLFSASGVYRTTTGDVSFTTTALVVDVWQKGNSFPRWKLVSSSMFEEAPL